ncbi:FtsX-like permease family protein [Magnetovirga frankeli]|uniref:ABC transporter permease n=1 Tax=Magnetovirga frankeli TaxID=947516 RepID=UPI0012936B1E|nr:FtsX-like permease family protein [gamma proteobacterium SS-5]
MNSWLRQQHFLLDHALASLARRKALHLGLLLVLSLLVFSLASVMLFGHALRVEAHTLLSKAPELVLQRQLLGRHELIPAAHVATLRGLLGDDVRLVPRLWGYHYDPLTSSNYSLLAPNAASGQAELTPGETRIGPGVAQARGASVGDLLSFRTHDGQLFPLKVVEILPADSAILSADLILLNEADFRHFFGISEGWFTDVQLSGLRAEQRPQVESAIRQALPDLRLIDQQQMLKTYSALFDWRGGLVLVLWVGAGLALLIFVVQKASGLSAQERNEVGILRALGWRTQDVLLLKCWEGLLISLAAFLIGYVLAYWHVFGTGAALLQPVLKGWSVLHADYRLVPFIDAGQLLLLSLATLLPYTLAGIGPIWRAARAEPDQVMR